MLVHMKAVHTAWQRLPGPAWNNKPCCGLSMVNNFRSSALCPGRPTLAIATRSEAPPTPGRWQNAEHSEPNTKPDGINTGTTTTKRLLAGGVFFQG